MTKEEEVVIKRDFLESIIREHLLSADDMARTILLFGEHYTYRDSQRFHQWAAQELERHHLYLVGYDESTKRIRKLREAVAAEGREKIKELERSIKASVPEKGV